MFDFLQFLDENEGVVQTAREQARLDERDMDQLMWSDVFPRTNVNSIRISEMRLPDQRPVASRREWSGSGRRIPVRSPDERTIEMIPIGTEISYEEYEMQRMAEQMNGQQELIADRLRADIPDRIDMHADAAYRRIEVDAHHAWLNGEIRVRNPETGETYTVSLQFDGQRYVSEDWSGGSDAYASMLDAIRDADSKLRGGVAGALVTQDILFKMRDDAPAGEDGRRMTTAELNQAFSGDLGREFTVSVADLRSADVFDGTGTSTTRTPYFDSGKVAFVPQGGQIGTTAFAPIARAFEYANQDERISVRDLAVFYIVANNGKSLTIEPQLNAMPIPLEEFVTVYDTNI